MLDPGLEFQPLRKKEQNRRRPAPDARHLRLVPNLDPLLTRRDTDLVRKIYPWIAWMVDYYYRAEFEGVDHLRDDACLTVATHNGSLYTPDAYCLMVAFWRRFGLEAPGYGLMHKAAFRIPVFGDVLTRLGAVPANRESARVVLEGGFPCVVCPGGDVDALKPFSQRHRIVFGKRSGFISVAIRHQVPIVPVVSVGAHEVVMMLNEGRWLAEALGLTRHFRIKAAPLSLSFPFGLTPAGLFAMPLPSKIVVRVLPSIELAEPAEQADDPETIRRCFEHVKATMQRALDDLAARRRFPVLG